MQQVIDELLKAEAEAQKIIQQAQEEAQRIKAQVESDYSLKINEAREQARKNTQRTLEDVRRELLSANKAAVAEAEKSNAMLWQEKKLVIEQVTNELISLLATPEYERK